jgi:hypothetical protein
MGARTARANVAFLALVAAALVVVGCVSTWATVRGVAFTGTDANAGKSTLFASVVAALLLVLGTALRWRWLSIVAAIPAAIAAAISSYRLADIANFVQGRSDATASWGIWLTTIAAIVLLVLCVVHASLPVAEPAAEPAPPPAVEDEPPPPSEQSGSGVSP